MSDRMYDPTQTAEDTFSGDKSAVRLEHLRFWKSEGIASPEELKELIALEAGQAESETDRFIRENTSAEALYNEKPKKKKGFTAEELALELANFGKY